MARLTLGAQDCGHHSNTFGRKEVRFDVEQLKTASSLSVKSDPESDRSLGVSCLGGGQSGSS